MLSHKIIQLGRRCALVVVGTSEDVDSPGIERESPTSRLLSAIGNQNHRRPGDSCPNSRRLIREKCPRDNLLLGREEERIARTNCRSSSGVRALARARCARVHAKTSQGPRTSRGYSALAHVSSAITGAANGRLAIFRVAVLACRGADDWAEWIASVIGYQPIIRVWHFQPCVL